jgi:hypothetical protein
MLVVVFIGKGWHKQTCCAAGMKMTSKLPVVGKSVGENRKKKGMIIFLL